MILCGLMRPDAGSVSVMGEDMLQHGTVASEKDWRRPQEIALFPSLTAYENLFYFGRMYGLPVEL